MLRTVILAKLKLEVMKNFSFKAIAVGFLALNFVPAAVFSQTKKESRTIIIKNGDTVVNGKKISELNRSERDQVHKDFDNLQKKLKESQVEINGTGIIINRTSPRNGNITIEKSGKDAQQVFTWSNGDSIKQFRFNAKGFPQISLLAKLDSSKIAQLKIHGKAYKGLNDSLLFAMGDSAMVKRFEFNFDSRMPMLHPRPDIREMPNSVRPSVRTPGTYSETYAIGRNNSQSFSYSNTDKNGITTRMNIRLSEVGKDDIKKITGSVAPGSLTVEDITLFPNFSTGKMSLSFNLPDKGATDVKILDSDKNAVFTDRVSNFSGNYFKQINLPKNGIYYVAVSQNGKWLVKKLVKE